MTVVWSPEMAVGIRAIDLQHQELIGIINELESALANANAASLEQVLQQLLSYVVFHFETEELMMRARSAWNHHAERHVAQHGEFIARLEGIQAMEGATKQQAIAEMLTYLRHWLLDHIQKTDRDLADLLNSNPP